MAVLRLAAVIVAVFGGLVAIAHAQAPQLVVDVDVSDNRYTPANSTVAVGGTVKFAYAAGEEVHNAEFANRGVTCTTTTGKRTGASGYQVPFTSEGPAWAGNCTFPGPGVYRFICVDHSEMEGKVTVLNPDGTVPAEATPTPTPTPTPQGGTNNPPAGGGGPADNTPVTVVPPKLTVAASQRGQAVAGSIKGGSAASSVAVETLAPLKAKAKKPTRVGRATYSVAAGATKQFTLKLNAKGKAALKRLGRLKVTVRFTVDGKATTRTVTLRPDAKSKASTAQKSVTVSVKDNFFSPKSTTVARGGTVTWRWAGKKSHDVVGPGFKSKVIKTGTFKKTFSKKGTFAYVCTLHRGMTGTIRVK